MDVSIKKVGERDGQERFVLVEPKSRKVLTVSDVSASSLRRYFQRHGASDELVDRCLGRARDRFDAKSQGAAMEQNADTEDDDLLFELGLGGED